MHRTLLLFIFATGVLSISQAVDLKKALAKCEISIDKAKLLSGLLATFVPGHIQSVAPILSSEESVYLAAAFNYIALSGSPLGDILASSHVDALDLDHEGFDDAMSSWVEGLLDGVDVRGNGTEDALKKAPFNYADMANMVKAEESGPEQQWDTCSSHLDETFDPVLEHVTCLAKAIIYQYIPWFAVSIVEGIIGKAVPPTRPIQPFTWAILDAAFKPPTGILEGKLHWPGSFEECNMIHADWNHSVTDEPQHYRGKYCKIKTRPKGSNLTVGLSLGVCLPDTCVTDNITATVNNGDYTVSILNTLGLEVADMFCGHDLHMPTDSRAQLAISITAILGGLALLAGIYDGLYRKRILQRRLAGWVPVQSIEEMTIGHPNGAGRPGTSGVARSISYVEVHPEDMKRYSVGGMATSPSAGRANPNAYGNILRSTSTTKLYPQISEVDSVPGGPPVSAESLAQSHRNLQDVVNKQTQSYLDLPASGGERLEAAFAGFSAYSAMKTTFTCSKPGPDYFPSLDGIRFLSFCYAMAGMSFFLGTIYTETFDTGNLFTFILQYPEKFTFHPIMNFHLCVDSFLVISGFLVTYRWMQRNKENDGKVSIGSLVHFYLHRYWSLIPAFMLVLTFYTCLYKYFVYGPMVSPSIADAENCKENWWAHLLMVSNLVNTHNMCLSWTWYVPLVFQLHIITPFILFPIIKKVRAVAITLTLVFAIHIAVTAYLAAELYKQSGVAAVEDWYYDMLMVPWTRAGPYLVGIALAVFMFHGNKKMSIPWFVDLLFWLLSVACISSIAFSTFPVFKNGVLDLNPWTREITIALRTLGHTGWGLSIAWMIFSCETGHGGLARVFLRWPAFGPLGRLTYVGLLVSAILIIRNTSIQLDLIYFSFNNMMYTTIGNTVLVLIASCALGLAFLHPFKGLERAFLAKTKRDIFNTASSPLDDDAVTSHQEAPVVYSNRTMDDFIYDYQMPSTHKAAITTEL